MAVSDASPRPFLNTHQLTSGRPSDLVSPQLYLDSEAPGYRTGAIGVLTFSIIALCTALAMYAYLRHQNAVRDKLALTNPEADPAVPPEFDVDEDRTDMQDLKFRYML